MKEARNMEYELEMLSSISASLYTQFANSFLVPTTDNMNYYHFQKPVILEPQTLRTRSITLSIIIQGCTFHGPTFLNNSGMMRERIGGFSEMGITVFLLHAGRLFLVVKTEWPGSLANANQRGALYNFTS
jgi:hypothetical protein